MRKIILASRSKARRKLLKQIGLKFRAVEADVTESSCLKGRNCSALVMGNAVRKARAAAKKFDTGVVIAADTVVLVGRPRTRALQEIVAADVRTVHRSP